MSVVGETGKAVGGFFDIMRGSPLALALLLLLGSCCPLPELPNIGFEMASAESTPVMCADPASRETVRAIMSEALDTALKNHIVHMFEVWMRDDRGQPERARTGVTNGVAAYLRASKSVAAWAPPDCSG
jgi:hypothetical protein